MAFEGLKINIICAQVNPVVGHISHNSKMIEQVLQDAPDDTLVVFPEMVTCGYPPEDLVLKPSFIDSIEAAVADILKRHPDKDFILPSPWRVDGMLYNAALFIEQGKIKDIVLKHHLPNYGVFDEKRLFEQGPLQAPILYNGHKIGIMICEDMWFDNVAAHLKGEGAEILVIPNASPFNSTKIKMRHSLAKQRATQTDLPLVYVNQCGGQDELVFDGGSFAVNAQGHIIFQAPQFQEGTFMVTPNERADLPDQNEALYLAAMCGLHDYVSKNGFPGVLIGLSGGIDSALSAAIAVDAFGADRVHCVMMPSAYTSDESLSDAKAIADTLGVQYDIISIESSVDEITKAITSTLPDNAPDVTFENIQSRARGLILMALSNASGKMVLSTGNKSEMAVGYATLYGDMCGGFNALKDMYKTQVFALSEWRNTNKPASAKGPANNVMPQNVITKPPTAELKPNQTDQDSLPPYDVLDDILYDLIETNAGVDDITNKGHDRALVQKIWRMLDIAEYKRRQAPPGVKLTALSFGKDRRYPIVNGFSKQS